MRFLSVGLVVASFMIVSGEAVGAQSAPSASSPLPALAPPPAITPQGAAPIVPEPEKAVVLGLVVSEDSRRCGISGIPGTPSGACLQSIRPGGAAARGGLKAGDLIRRFGSNEIEVPADLTRLVRRALPGDKVAIVVERAGKAVELNILFTAEDLRPLIASPATSNGPITVASNPVLRQELLAMRDADQKPLQPGHENVGEATIVEERNLARIKQIIAQNGWPTISLVGDDGSSAAWLVVQHADKDKAFQRSVLAMIEPLVKTRDVSAINVAYLYDRTHTPQRYGTQGRCTPQHSWAPNEIEDAQHVDQRRAELKLPPMSEYIALSASMCDMRLSAPNIGPGRSSSPDK